MEVAPLGLSIYGNGRDNVVELLPFWRGVLPVGDVASLYASAKVSSECLLGGISVRLVQE